MLACLLACLFVCLFVFLFVCLFVCLVGCLFVCLFLCLFVCLFLCFLVSLFPCFFVSLCLCSLFVCFGWFVCLLPSFFACCFAIFSGIPSAQLNVQALLLVFSSLASASSNHKEHANKFLTTDLRELLLQRFSLHSWRLKPNPPKNHRQAFAA